MFYIYNDITEENEQLSDEIISLQKENDIFKKENEKIKKENEKLKRLNGNLIKILEQLDDPEIKKNLDIIKTDENFKIINNKIKINSKTNELIMNENIKNIKDIDAKDFYDVIIPINSIKDITKGWKIKMSKRAIERYEIFKNETIIKIGVIGNSNKGKSFILSKISKIDLPSGTSIRTEGLSIKYPELEEYKERKIALIDSAGLEAPVLNEEDEKKEDINEEEENEEEEEENEDLEKDENKNSKEKDENEEKNQKEISYLYNL